jgi:rhodanese-related sulfurtransferase
MVNELTPREFLDRRAAGAALTLVDVREEWEIAIAKVPVPHLHLPMGQVPDRIGELDPAAETVVICRSGGRSLQVANFLERRGFTNVHNLAGGILAWSRDIDPTIAQY